MIEIIHSTTQVARKKYRDDYFIDFFDYYSRPENMTFAELRIWVQYKRKRGVINPGDVYVRQFNKDVSSGAKWTFRIWEPMHKICCKYDLHSID